MAIDGTPTATWDDFLDVRARCGDLMRARIFRDGIEREIEIPLRPATKSPSELLNELQQAGITPIAPHDKSHAQH